MKSNALTLALIIALCPMVSSAQSFGGGRAPAQQGMKFTASGGTVGVRLNPDLLGDMGIIISQRSEVQPAGAKRLTDGFATRQALGVELFNVNPAGNIGVNVDRGALLGFASGSLKVQGGYVFEIAAGESLDLTDFSLRPNAADPLRLDVVGRDGTSWFYLDKLMYEILPGSQVLAVYTSDLRASAALAERLGHPEMSDHIVGDVEVLTEVDQPGVAAMMGGTPPNPSHWPGDQVAGQPTGTVYQADLFMQSFSISRMRQTGTSGHEGSGRVVFAPSSTLRNNVNNGTAAVTVSGQGALGTSSALFTAWIPWNQKFTGNTAPYGNDQHPYLIWNMYRINADGGIEQIGRSGVKHAWLTTNGGCASGENFSGQVLGRSCSDTYGTGNNDANQDLSVRSEIVPVTSSWGRCGSIFDPNCVGSNTRPNPTDDGYVRRLVVTESQISNTKNPGATYLFDSWYLARQDINIYNSMATLTGVPTYSGGNWNFGSQGNYKLGSVTDRWVENVPAGTQAANVEVAVAEGHSKVAVRAINLGNGQWRYHYAVHNLDFARAQTSGTEPNLRVIKNSGFSSFSVPVGSATITDVKFSDGDLIDSNDWAAKVSNGVASWTPQQKRGTLDWGTLFLFSFTSNQAPVQSSASLKIAEPGQVQTLVANGILTPAVSATRAPGFRK